MPSTYTVVIRKDAENKELAMEVLDSGGVQVAVYGSVSLMLGEDPGGLPDNPGHTMGKEIKLRETVGCDPATGDPRYAMFLRSEWYATKLTDAPET